MQLPAENPKDVSHRKSIEAKSAYPLGAGHVVCTCELAPPAWYGVCAYRQLIHFQNISQMVPTILESVVDQPEAPVKRPISLTYIQPVLQT
jgi:hypothetical protein